MKEESITFEVVLEEIKENIKDKRELKEITKAYNYPYNKHLGKKRLNGEDFITHPLTVARIVNSLNVDATTIIAALIHEVMNEEDVSRQEISLEFGDSVATICDSLNKINKLELVESSDASAIYLRKVLVGLASDVRVIFIKLADRLHNMRTNYVIDKKKQKQKAYETQAVLIPIAHRLGINSIKSELEDLCLYYTKRDVYEDILEKLNDTKNELQGSLQDMQDSIINILTEQGLKFKIKGRVKSVHSIYNKLSNGKKWNEIYDILALRVILDSVSDCYLAVGLIHAKYRPIPKRFKDYIAMPKANMYQSLHTTVFGVDGHLFEIQFRTHEMDEFAEKGMASHWSYKEKGTRRGQNLMEQKLEMFRNLIETNDTLDDQTFLREVTSDMLAQMIYVFTPKGDVIELPSGSTPVDFAYRIHSDVGDKMVGAIVNDNIVSLNYELKDNDIVKIKTSSSATPNKDWLGFVKTSQAKNKIKSYFSKQERTFLVHKGQEILEKEIRKRKMAFSEVLSEENIKKITKELKLKDIEEVYLAIGTLRFTAGYIISIVKESKEKVPDLLMGKINQKSGEEHNYKNDIIVEGVDNIMVNLAKCCKPVKGEEIVGYITKGSGITIHKKNCLNIESKSERLILVNWNMEKESSYFTDLEIITDNAKNYVAQIMQILSQANIYIDSLKTKESGNKYILELTIKVKSIEEVDKIKKLLEQTSYILEVRR